MLIFKYIIAMILSSVIGLAVVFVLAMLIYSCYQNTINQNEEL